MPVISAQQAYDEIKAHIVKEGGPPGAWYSGIASDISARLFGDHSVPRENHWYAFRKTQSAADARSVEKMLINQLGTDGGPGGGDEDSVFVYSYKKSSVTTP